MNPVGKPEVTRRLAAIVIADVVGYTRLMERDDTGTFARLRTIRDEVVDPAIVSHGGRIVKTAGDGLLAEFPSALSALRASVQIQREMARRNDSAAADERIDYRIGVNLGDIIVDGDDIAGDGVNLASRLETLAEPGGICVSGAVRDQVHGQLDAKFADIGEQQVKNIARPIHAWRVVVKGGVTAAAMRGPRSTLLRPRTWLGVGALALATATVAAVWWWSSSRMANSSASAPPMSIAVLPLGVSSANGDGAALAQRLTRDVITGLARGKRSVRVTPYSLVSGFKGETDDPRAVGRALAVRYVADGEIRLTQGRATLTTRLYDGETAIQLSMDATHVDEPDAVARDDMLVARAVGQIRASLIAAERERARGATGNSATDRLARADAIRAAGDYSLAATRDGLKIIDDVLAREPDNGAALVRRFWYLNTEYEEDLHADRDRIFREMDQATSRAVAIDPRDAEAWHARAINFAWQGRWAEAEAALAEARRLDPANPDYLEQRAFFLMTTGRSSEVSALIDEVVKRTGSYTDVELRDLCWANLAPGRYERAVPACEKTVAYSTWWNDEMYLAAAYAQAGQLEKAKQAAARLVKAKPDISIELLRNRRYSSHPDFRRWEEEEVFAGLRKAGIPER